MADIQIVTEELFQLFCMFENFYNKTKQKITVP